MSNGEILYLALVLASFTAFAVTLAVVSHGSGHRQEAVQPARPKQRAAGERHAH